MILVAGDRRRPTSFINELAETFQLLYRNEMWGLDVLVGGWLDEPPQWRYRSWKVSASSLIKLVERRPPA